MKRFKKFFMVLALFACAISLFATGKAEKGDDESEFVTLTMYLVGDTVPDYGKMLDVLNERLKKDINAELDVKFTTWVDYQTKLRLMLVSGEEIDLVHTAPWHIYNEQSQAGSFVALEDLAPIYAPKTWAGYSEAVLEQTRVNGHVYMLPFNFSEPLGQGIVYRKDLADKYGIGVVNSREKLMEYMIAVKAGEGMIPYNAGEFDLSVWPNQCMEMQPSMPNIAVKRLMPITGSDGIVPFVLYDDANKIYVEFETDAFMEAAEYTREMYQKGLIPRNVLSNTVGSREAFLAGQSAITTLNPLNANELYLKVSSSHPEWELDYWLPMDSNESFEKAPAINNGISIPVASKHPERALMLLELLHQDQFYNDLSSYGIRGEHWTVDANGDITAPEGLNLANSGFPWDQPCPWGWREEKFYRLNVLKSSSAWSAVKKSQEAMSKIGVDQKWTGFSFDKSPVSTEISALNTVRSGVMTAMSWGVVDPKEGYAQLKDEFARAGLETVRAELKKQWSAYLATLK